MKMKVLLAAAVVALASGCTNGDKATRVLSDQGYTNIQMTGYGFFDCSEDDFFATGFRATSPAGRPVEGTVCSGLFKGNTIRLD